MRLIGLVGALGGALAASSTSDEKALDMASQIAAAIDETAVSVMQIPKLQQIVNEQSYTLVEVDGTVEAASAAAQVARVFNNKAELLDAISAAAVDAYAADVSGGTADLTWDATGLSADDLGDYDDAKFFTEVDDEASAFLPSRGETDETTVLRTAEMEGTFELNADSDSELVFQYFAAADNGMLRAHPAAAWADPDPTDARLASWYVRAVSGPKNVVVLLDVAGSGAAHLEYLLLAARGVLSGLHQDDWAQFVVYDRTAAAPLGGADCYSDGTLVRATEANKEVWAAALDELTELSGGTGDVGEAVSLALSMVDASLDNGLGSAASCETTVLVLSGTGGSGSDSSGGSNPHGARFLTYNLGGGGDDGYLKGLSCANDGLFTKVDSASGALDVGLYYEVAGYAQDEVVYSYGRGLRPDLMEAADPDYDLSYWTMAEAVRDPDSGELLGVAALDFVMYGVKDTLENLRFQQSFPILVNAEGDTLYHPLQTQYKKLNLFDVGRDISNYEYFDDWDTAVRPFLVAGDMGDDTLTVQRALIKGDAQFEGMDVEEITTTYFWQQVPSMPFYLAFAYAEADLTQRVRLPSRYDMTESIYCTFTDSYAIGGDLEDLIPEAAYDTVNPRLDGLLAAGQAIFNEGNCQNSTGHNFGNCKEDDYCVEHGLNCDGDCVCEPHRWPVNTIATHPCVHFAPKCWEDPTTAFVLDRDADEQRELHSFYNRFEGATNPNPVVREECLSSAEITFKNYPNVKEASVAGLHDDTVWLYFGAATGSISIFPANSWGNGYDPTRRPWYSRAIAYKGQYQHVISTPYLDAGGGGLMNTFAEAVWEERQCSDTACSPDIISDRVFGVSGWDMLYPDFDAFASDSTNGSCSTLSVLDHTAAEDVPMCFLFDPAGLLLSHSDFLLSVEEAEAAGLQVEITGDAGVWPIENVFLGKKEPPLAQALIDAGFFTYREDQLSETGQLRLNFYESDPSVLEAAGGVISGTLDASDVCYQGQPEWRLLHLNQSNAFLLIVDNYERHDTATWADCEPVVAADAEEVPDDTCAWSSSYRERARGQRACPLHDKPDTYALEPARASYAKCEEEEFIQFDEGVGQAVFIVTLLILVLVLALAAAIFVFRKRYIMKASSPVFCYLMCVGGALGCVFLLLFIGEPSDGTCHARQWVGGLAFVFLFGPLFAKTWRINKIFNNQSLKKVKITNADLFKAVAGLLGVDVLIQLLWSAVVNTAVVRTPDEDDALLVHVGCDGDGFGTFAAIHYVFITLVVLYGVKLSWNTRSVQGEFNESQSIGAAIYNTFFMGVIIVPMVYGLDVSYEAEFVLIALGSLATVVVTLSVIFVPKFMVLNKTAKEFEATGTQGTAQTSGATRRGSRGSKPGTKYSAAAASKSKVAVTGELPPVKAPSSAQHSAASVSSLDMPPSAAPSGAASATSTLSEAK